MCCIAKDQCHDNNPEIIRTHNIQRDNRKIESSIYENLLMAGRLLSNDSHAYLLIAKQTLGKISSHKLYSFQVHNWRIIPRSNPASDYPSDFDVILLEEDSSLSGLEAIKSHPLVKSVTPQRMVHRTLKYIPVSKDEIEAEQTDNDLNNGSNDANDEENEKLLQELIEILNSNPSESHAVYQRKLQSLPEINLNQTGKENGSNSQQNATYLNGANRHINRRLLRAISRQITSLLRADVLWSLGITGKGIKVAVFDTGLSKNHPHFKRIKERTNWTNEKSLDDGVSHGTFVAGVRIFQMNFARDLKLIKHFSINR